MKCVPYVQHILNYFHCFCTSTIKIVPVQIILYQFKNKLFQSKNWTTTDLYSLKIFNPVWLPIIAIQQNWVWSTISLDSVQKGFHQECWLQTKCLLLVWAVSQWEPRKVQCWAECRSTNSTPSTCHHSLL